jgi:hypothetical protein
LRDVRTAGLKIGGESNEREQTNYEL